MMKLNERRDLWMAHYQLKRWEIRGFDFCIRPLIGLRCLDYYSRKPCHGCVGHDFVDHGVVVRGPNGLRMIVSEPYRLPDDDGIAFLASLVERGLHYHIGGVNQGWYHMGGTYPIVISNQPIPEHCYRFDLIAIPAK